MTRIFITFIFILINLSNLIAQEDAQKVFSSGVANLKQRNYEKAINDFTIVLEKGKTKEGLKMSYIYRGFAKDGLGKFNEAIADFNKAIEIDPTDLATYIDRANSKSYLKDFDGAISDYKYVVSIDSLGKDAEISYFYLGLIAYKTADYKISIYYFDKMLKLAPSDSEAYFNRGVAKSMLMDIDGSIADYDNAIKYNPNYKEAYANRGTAKINLLTGKGNINPTKKQTTDACSDLRKAKDLGDNTVDDMIFLYCDKK